MIQIEQIIEKVGQNHPGGDMDMLRRAYFFSAKHHAGQTRASGEPYLVHPLEVSNILADMRLDEIAVSTGLLLTSTLCANILATKLPNSLMG
jgi:GTP diphosphokinase / guanosine-3',5'-bis(diphosphate) 3'-diphosphatase